MAVTNERLRLIPVIIETKILAVDPDNVYQEVVLYGEWPELGKIVPIGPDKALTLHREIVPREIDDGYPPYGQAISRF